MEIGRFQMNKIINFFHFNKLYQRTPLFTTNKIHELLCEASVLLLNIYKGISMFDWTG